MNNVKYKYKNILIYLAISLVISLFVQIMILPNKDNLYNNIEFNSINSKMDIINYDIKDSTFIAKDNDPQLLFRNINSEISAVEINFAKPILEDINIQVFFAENGKDLSEENSATFHARKEEEKCIIEIPYNNYSTIRIDIGSKLGQSFELDNIKICKSKITFFEKNISKIEILNLLLLTCIIFILLNIVSKYKTKILNEQNGILEIIFIIFCFIMFTLWSIVQPFNSCPDELMRYDVIKYVFYYNKLPHGGDPLIINKIWGFSYAFLPYLSGLISVLFMKFLSIFTTNERALILAARMAVVCFGTVTVYYVIKIANKCFKDKYKWLFIILICCLPQFVFLSSYMNNDMLALLSIAMMIYYWIEGYEKKWDIKTNIGLAIAVSICLLSYYNAYTFILFSIVFFIWSNIYNKEDKSTIFKRFMTVTIIVFILSGWWFIRNGILYHGDFIGMSTMDQYSNIYAMEEIKPINRLTPLKQGVSVLFMLFNMNWLKETYLSFIGRFGYMNIPIYGWMYLFYTIIIFVGLIFFAFKAFELKKKKDNKYVFYICIALAGIITILLSIYRSYKVDLQPQGRYVIECLIPLMMFVTIGFENMCHFIGKKFRINHKKLIFIICILCILISVVSFTKVIIPKYI